MAFLVSEVDTQEEAQLSLRQCAVHTDKRDTLPINIVRA